MGNDWLQVAQEALKVPGLLVEIYGDLARPGVKQVGKALETVLGFGNTILWPILWVNERTKISLEKNLENLRKKLENIPEEKIVQVTPEIGVPIAEKLAYVSDEYLSELYVSLLAKASNTDTVSQAHPSFVNVINNISPDEAKFLEFYLSESEGDIAFLTAKWDAGNMFQWAGKYLLSPTIITSLKFPQNVPAYVSNLAGLGLHEPREDLTLTKRIDIFEESDIYSVIEKYWRSEFTPDKAPEEQYKIRFEPGVIQITEFGVKFLEACHSIKITT